MNERWLDRLARALEGNRISRSLVLRFDGIAPSGHRRYVNRISGHVTTWPAITAKEAYALGLALGFIFGVAMGVVLALILIQG